MALRCARLVPFFVAALTVCLAQSQWSAVYLYDEDESTLVLQDLAVTSAQNAIALGRWSDGRRERTALVESGDSGKTWKMRHVSPHALSLYFLNSRDGWMVAKDGIHRTANGGSSWKQIYKSKTLVRCWFVDRERGFAVGTDKTAMETRDGGLSWTPLAAAAEQNVEAERTLFNWIEFRGDTGVITGYHRPRRRISDFPEWMDPELAELRRPLPSLSIVLQTLDRGVSWKGSVASMFGSISRVRGGPGGRAVSVVEFEPQFEWPSEVYEIDSSTGQADRVFRERDRHVTDAMFLPDGRLVLAAIITPGRMHHLPVPGPVEILIRDGTAWSRMPVDYRAAATRVAFSSPPEGAPWAITDTGMILRLQAGR